MTRSRPAAIYAPGTSEAERRAIDEVLDSHRLFRADRFEETLEHLARPAWLRPQLRRTLLFPITDGVTTLVCDHISSLGSTPAEQVAVVGLLLDRNVGVLVGDEWLTGARYLAWARDVDFRAARAHLDDQNLLLGLTAEGEAGHADLFNWMRPSYAWCESQSYPAAAGRAFELLHVSAPTHSPTEVARRLQREGYRNRTGRVAWYTANVREAAADRRALSAWTRDREPAQ